jgi:hypothetical protein
LWQSVVFVAAMVIGMLLWDRRDALIPVATNRTRPVARGATAR